MIYQPMPEMKTCSKGEACVNPRGPWLPATWGYFYTNNANRDQLNGCCRLCAQEKAHKHYREHKERHNQQSRDWHERNKGTERYKEQARQKTKRYYEKHRTDAALLESARSRAGAWRASNLSRVVRNQKNWKINNPDKAQRAWSAANLRRRARRRSLPNVFIANDWQHALDYFKGCCAVCGRQPGLWHKIAADHWIPVTDPRPDNPGTVPWNLVPLCHGAGGCNNSKSGRPADVFVIEKLGPIKGKAKLKEIQAYLDSRKDEAGK